MKPITLFNVMSYINKLEESEFVIVDEDNNEYNPGVFYLNTSYPGLLSDSRWNYGMIAVNPVINIKKSFLEGGNNNE